MADAGDVLAFLADRITDPETGWSLGTFGAIAEFIRAPDEPVTLTCAPDAVAAVTPRGALRIAPPPRMRPVASETPVGDGWNHRVALCLPTGQARMGRREVLTELGPDHDALRAEDRDGILIDLGLDCFQVDACIRIADPALLEPLRRGLGRPLFDPGNAALRPILAASPHRVFVSCLGRIEIFGGIPSADCTSPTGRTPMCCRSCCSRAAPMRQPSRCRRAWCPAPTSIRHIRSRMRSAARGRSIRRDMRHSSRSSSGSAIQNFSRSSGTPPRCWNQAAGPPIWSATGRPAPASASR